MISKGSSESVNLRTDNVMARKKKEKRINNNLQNITQKTKDRAKQTPPNICGDLRFSRRQAVPAPRVAPVVLFSIYMIHNMKKKLI